MKLLIKAAIAALLAATAALADPITSTHYRCWDLTRNVSPGGWVSYEWMAWDNCRAYAVSYPYSQLTVQAEYYGP